jgi:D-sedoheptulose 7-phosphate isomerase
MDQTLFQHLQNHIETTMAVGEDCADKISDAAEKITGALLAGRTIYSCGIEETTTLSQLFVNYLTSGYQIERPGFPAIDLEAVVNNAKDDECFSRSLYIHGQSDDVMMVFSSGGNNPILINTIESAVEQGMLVILLSASDDNQLSDKLCNNDIEIATANYGREFKATVGFLIIQCLCKLIDNKIFGEN